MRISFRQGIVTAPQDFLEPTGTRVDLVLAPPALITVAFADGASNYLHTERTAVVNAWAGPFVSGTDYWLYWDLNVRTGVRTFGHTALAPVQSPTAPTSPLNDQHWFDTVANKMKVWNATTAQWISRIRVFACKLDSGTTPASVSVNTPAFTGSQVSTLSNTPAQAGALVFDINGDVVKRSNNTFFTTEDVVSANISTAAQIKLGAVLVEAVTVASIPAYSVVRFVDFHQVDLATSSVNVNGAYGIIEQDGPAGSVVNVAMEGVITNPAWDWSALPVNTPLYLGTTGNLSPTITAQPVVVATVIDRNTILLRAAIVTYGSSGGGGGADLAVEDNGVVVNAATTTINFGTGIDVTNVSGGEVLVALTPVVAPPAFALAVEDDAVTVETNTNVINFGTNLTVVAGVDGTVTVNATGGGGSSYDQDLNTTDAVEFLSVETTDVVVPDDQSLSITLNSTSAPAWLSVVGDASIDTEDNYPSGVAFDSTGAVLLAQGDGSTGTVKVVKLAANGSAVWSVSLNQAVPISLVGGNLTVDPSDNSVYVMVVEQGAVTATTIVKLSSAGSLLWQYRVLDPVSITDSTQGQSMVVDSQGNLIVGLNTAFQGALGFVDQPVIIKMSAAGAVLWTAEYSVGTEVRGANLMTGLAVDATNNIYVSVHNKPVTASPDNVGVLKFDPAGALVWQNSYLTPDRIRSGTLCVNGSTVVVGIACSTSPQVSIGFFALNATTGAIGVEVYRQFTDSSTNVDLTDIAADAQGNIYVFGTHPSNSGDVYIGKFTAAGSAAWERTVSGPSSEFDRYSIVYAGGDVRGSTLTFAVTSYSSNSTTLNGAEVLTGSLPTNGTATGAVLGYTYAAFNTAPYVLSTGAAVPLTGTTGAITLTIAADTLVGTASPSQVDTAFLSQAQYVWEFGADGFGPSGYNLPNVPGAVGSVLTSGGGDAVLWQQPAPQTIRFSPDSGTFSSVESLGSVTTGQSNLAIGVLTLSALTTGTENVAIGSQSSNNTNGSRNVAVGHSSFGFGTGSDNVAVGHRASGFANSAARMVAVGSSAARAGAGTDSVAVGYFAMDQVNNPVDSVAVGSDAMGSAGNAGADNVAIGRESLFLCSGTRNVAVGSRAQRSPALGGSNVAVGTEALNLVNQGANNTAIGDGAGNTIVSGSNNILIGSGVTTPDASTSNFVRVGNTSITTAEIAVAWTITSDARDKTDIVDLDIGLDFINQLAPRKFKLADRETGAATTSDRYGFIAQEIPDAQIVSSTDPEHLKVNETMMIAVLVKAVQEQSAIIDDLKARVAALEA